MVNIEINGIAIQARDGAMVIEAADEAGITIPRFCYHKKLSIAANCRMCLVEVEKVAKPLPACATPVTEGMKVFTRSPRAIAAQRGVMEFLLINHPLDCPICDQGGECDLQEMAMGYGQDISRYQEGKRVVQDQDIGPLIATDMTRCIHCTRCVRFGQEIAGVMELGATGRGEHTRIGTYVARSVDSELSGNVIDLCPVGALTSKPYRYSARPWELTSYESVSPHDCVGANLRVDTRRDAVMRVVARDNEEVNETWIADRDRFSYTALTHPERLTSPWVKRDGKWEECDWDTALTTAAEGLKKISEGEGADQVGALAGYTATTEELYLLQKLMRGMGSGNIDHRLRQQDFSDQADAGAFPWLGQSLQELEQSDVVLLVGSNLRKEVPLLNLRLRKAVLGGGAVIVVNPADYRFNYPVEKIIAAPSALAGELATIAMALVELSGAEAPKGLAPLAQTPGERHEAIAKQLREGKRSSVLVGPAAASYPTAATLRRLSALIAKLSGAKFGLLAEGGNSAGAWLAGAVPHRGAGAKATEAAGKSWTEMFSAGLKGYLLLGVEPELDCLDSGAALKAMSEAQFVVGLTAYATDAMREYADVLLPLALFPETSGTLVNTEGRWQSFNGCASPAGDARPGWKLLRVLGNLLDVPGFEQMSSEEVLRELHVACEGVEPGGDLAWVEPDSTVASDLVRIGDFPIHATDPMVRRAAPLQHTHDALAAAVYLSASTRKRLGLEGAESVTVAQGDAAVVLPIVVDERFAEGSVFIPGGVSGSVGLGNGFGAVELKGGD